LFHDDVPNLKENKGGCKNIADESHAGNGVALFDK
jgi:hypothetical protein